MESEFSASLFVLGRRIPEGKAPVQAFSTTANALKGSKIGEAFERISMNLLSMRTTLQASIFNEELGAFRHIYSKRIRNTMLLFTQSVHKNHEAAGTALIKMANHLKELGDVEERICLSLYDVTATMRSTAAIFAPLIAGITLALSEVITKILIRVAGKLSTVPQNTGLMPVQLDSTALSQTIPPDHFLLIIGIYLCLICAVLTCFAGAIEYGGDRNQLRYDLSGMLPLSVIIFMISTVASRVIFRGFV